MVLVPARRDIEPIVRCLSAPPHFYLNCLPWGKLLEKGVITHQCQPFPEEVAPKDDHLPLRQ